MSAPSLPGGSNSQVRYSVPNPNFADLPVEQPSQCFRIDNGNVRSASNGRNRQAAGRGRNFPSTQPVAACRGPARRPGNTSPVHVACRRWIRRTAGLWRTGCSLPAGSSAPAASSPPAEISCWPALPAGGCFSAAGDDQGSLRKPIQRQDAIGPESAGGKSFGKSFEGPHANGLGAAKRQSASYSGRVRRADHR